MAAVRPARDDLAEVVPRVSLNWRGAMIPRWLKRWVLFRAVPAGLLGVSVALVVMWALSYSWRSGIGYGTPVWGGPNYAYIRASSCVGFCNISLNWLVLDSGSSGAGLPPLPGMGVEGELEPLDPGMRTFFFGRTWHYRLLTFEYSSSAHGARRLGNGGRYMTTQYVVVLPDWFLAALFGLPGAWLIHVERRRTRRIAAGGCATCGYDLRAHTAGEKCPECGAVIAGAVGNGGGAVGVG